MNTRRKFTFALGASLASPALLAQPRAKPLPRIAYLSVATEESDRAWLAAFRDGMKELGYVEGENVVIESRHAARDAARLPALVRELTASKVDVFVIYGAPALQAVQSALAADGGNMVNTPNTPIVLPSVVDPLSVASIKSFARPGGNVTGFSDMHASMVGKRLQLLKELVPGAGRVAVVYNPTLDHAVRQVDDLKTAAAKLGLRLLAMPVSDSAAGGIERAFAPLVAQRPGALLVIPDGAINRNELVSMVIKQRLPAIGTVREWADAGFVMSYGTSFADMWRRSATYVDKILKGAKAGDLPIQQPTTFEMVVNLKTAKALRLKVPQTILIQATKVIE